MKLRFSIELSLTREPPEESFDPQPEGSYATVETAPPHYPLGFSPNEVEARKATP